MDVCFFLFDQVVQEKANSVGFNIIPRDGVAPETRAKGTEVAISRFRPRETERMNVVEKAQASTITPTLCLGHNARNKVAVHGLSFVHDKIRRSPEETNNKFHAEQMCFNPTTSRCTSRAPAVSNYGRSRTWNNNNNARMKAFSVLLLCVVWFQVQHHLI